MQVTDEIAASSSNGPVMVVGRDVAAVLNALSVLRVISEAEHSLTLTAVARGAGLSPSTTLNLLRTLVNEFLLSFNATTKSYQLGLGLLELAGPLINQSDVELVQAQLQQIADRYETTATIWRARSDGRLALVLRLIPSSSVRVEFRVASRLPPCAGATGASVAAVRNLPPGKAREMFANVKWANPPTVEEFLDSVGQARMQGYAVDVGRLIRGVASVAAVACDRSGAPSMVLSAHAFVGQLSSLQLAELGQDLAGLAAQVSATNFAATVAQGKSLRLAQKETICR